MRLFAIAGAVISLAATSPLPVAAQEVTGAATVTGAGSTFAYPLLSEWSSAYRRWVAGGGDFPTTGSGLDDPPAGPVLDYEPIGSLAGTMRVTSGGVDFGASDVPLKSEDLLKLGLVQFPIIIGGIVAVVNIDGIEPGEIKFTGPLLADIFAGNVQSWADPAIKTLNPDLELPDAAINVVHRSDGSGTTFNFTDYLSKVSPAWRDTVGSDLIVKWPSGTGAKGNEGVAAAVKATRHSIGYVEYAQALRSGLSYAAIANRSGAFVSPEPSAFQSAAAHADWQAASDFHLLLTDAPGEGAYPIVATVFVLMQKTLSPQRARATVTFFEWSLDRGAKDAAGLGYVPLPPEVVKQVKDSWAKNFHLGNS